MPVRFNLKNDSYQGYKAPVIAAERKGILVKKTDEKAKNKVNKIIDPIIKSFKDLKFRTNLIFFRASTVLNRICETVCNKIKNCSLVQKIFHLKINETTPTKRKVPHIDKEQTLEELEIELKTNYSDYVALDWAEQKVKKAIRKNKSIIDPNYFYGIKIETKRLKKTKQKSDQFKVQEIIMKELEPYEGKNLSLADKRKIRENVTKEIKNLRNYGLNNKENLDEIIDNNSEKITGFKKDLKKAFIEFAKDKNRDLFEEKLTKIKIDYGIPTRQEKLEMTEFNDELTINDVFEDCLADVAKFSNRIIAMEKRKAIEEAIDEAFSRAIMFNYDTPLNFPDFAKEYAILMLDEILNNPFRPKEKPTLNKASSIEQTRAKILQAAKVGRQLGLDQASSDSRVKLLRSKVVSEAIDMKHRYGAKLNKIFEVWKKSETSLSFNEWMEKIEKGEEVAGKQKLISKKLLDDKNRFIHKGKVITHVKYYSAEERKQRELQTIGGDSENEPISAFTPAEGVLNTGKAKHHPHNFVVSPDHKVYVVPYSKGFSHHSSLLAGGPVIAAGQLVFADGKLVKIIHKSGHYGPDRWMLEVGLRELEKLGLNLTDVPVYFPGGKRKMELSADQFLQNANSREKEISQSDYCHGTVSELEAEKLLADKEEGSWFVRWSEEQQGLIVSQKSDSIKHFFVKNDTLDILLSKFQSEKAIVR